MGGMGCKGANRRVFEGYWSAGALLRENKAKGADRRDKNWGKRCTGLRVRRGGGIEVVFEVEFGGFIGGRSNEGGRAMTGGGGWNLGG